MLTPQKAADAWRLADGQHRPRHRRRVRPLGRQPHPEHRPAVHPRGLVQLAAAEPARPRHRLLRPAAPASSSTSSATPASTRRSNAPVFSQHGGTVAAGLQPDDAHNPTPGGGTICTRSTARTRGSRAARSPPARSATPARSPSAAARPSRRACVSAANVWSALNEAAFATGVSDAAGHGGQLQPAPRRRAVHRQRRVRVRRGEERRPGQPQPQGRASSPTGIEFTFGDVNLAPGESGVVVRNRGGLPVALRQRPPGSWAPTAASDSNNLSNGGEHAARSTTPPGSAILDLHLRRRPRDAGTPPPTAAAGR